MRFLVGEEGTAKSFCGNGFGLVGQAGFEPFALRGYHSWIQRVKAFRGSGCAQNVPNHARRVERSPESTRR